MAKIDHTHDRLQEIFLSAIELKSRGERATYLEEACGDNDSLREPLEALLREYEDGSGGTSFGSGASLTEDNLGSTSPEELGTMIGRYKLLERIGEGGFGTVYAAEQTEPVVRRVALKVIKPGMDSREVIARFEAERQALAMMDDPNIARVYDAGATASGRPYFVMELVDGVPITRFCNEHELETRQRLDIFLDVCSAVQHAHLKGIIHRDLKPSNILVSLKGDKPVPKVIDFGVAKATEQQLTDKTLLTRINQFIGTPAYMSPEQAALSGGDIDTRSDIYALGVLLYELLTGIPPFDAKSLVSAGYDEMRRIIREVEPPKPSTRLRSSHQVNQTSHDITPRALRGDLDWIVMKAIEKERSRRYTTANALGMDIRRHLNNETVVAGAPSVTYKLWKFVSRNRFAVAAASMIVILLVVGISTSMWFAVRATTNLKSSKKNEELTQTALLQLKQQIYRHSIFRAQSALSTSEPATIHQLLDECPEDLRGWEWSRLNWKAERRVRTVQTHLEGESDVSVTMSLNGTRIAVRRKDETVTIWEVPSLKKLGTLQLKTLTDAKILAFGPDGDRIATGSPDGDIRIWDVSSGQVLQTLAGQKDGVRSLVFSPSGERVASGNLSGSVKVWDTTSGDLVRTLGRHEAGVDCIAYAPDGRFIGSASRDGKILIWHTSSGKLASSMAPKFGPVCLEFYSTEKQTIIAAAMPRTIELWDAESGEYQETIRSRGTIQVSSVQFDAGGQRLLTAGASLRLRETESWNEQLVRFGESRGFKSAAFLGTDQIVAVDLAGGILIENLSPDPDVFTIRKSDREEWFVQFSPGGDLIASACGDGTTDIWDADTRQLLHMLEPGGVVRSLSFRPDGRQLATSSLDGHVKLWNVATGALELTLLGHTDGVSSAAYSPDGEIIASASNDGTVRIWSTKTGQHLRTYTGHTKWVWWLDFSPDGKRIVSGSTAGELKIWDPHTTETLLTLAGHDSEIDALTFSPDGDYITSGSYRGIIKIWDSVSGQNLKTMRGHGLNLSAVVYSPDGLRLFSVADDATLKAWNPKTGQELLSFPTREAGSSIDISPDGKTLAISSTQGGTIELLETALQQESPTSSSTSMSPPLTTSSASPPSKSSSNFDYTGVQPDQTSPFPATSPSPSASSK
jgi:WD40 repeat protein/serine/threonine protein kinase